MNTTAKILRGLIFVVAMLSFVVVSPTTFAARSDTRERLKELGAVPCPNSAFTCVTLTVPLDHFNPQDTRTIDVVFAVLPATGARKGMFVTATGGPGSAGIACCADYYTTFFTPEIPEKFDIVFFDQRGIGLSGGLDCFQAAAPFYQADWRADTAKREQKLRAAAKTFADDCDAEMGHPEILPYLGTEQAVEDLELFRQMLGDEKFWLYGESYGTQYAQTYAHAHPEHLAGMILDGTVDLTPAGIPYYAAAAQSFSDTLVASLAQCQANETCANDFGMKPLRAYDKLAKLLQGKKQTLAFPLGDGSRVKRKFGFGDLDTTGEGQMYGQSSRMLFVRALAAYARDGDLVPLTRLLYPNLGVDETTLEPIYDATWSDAYYYAVECQDYGYFAGTNEARADQYVANALPVELSSLRLSALIWGDLPCVYWRDSSQDTTRPPYWSAPGVPTLVLNAEADPITPIAGARAVYEHLDDGYLIVQRGGPHVIFARGNLCIDNAVNVFLLNDQMPAQRETECSGKVMSKYVALAPREAREFPSLLAAMQSAETEINYLPEYYYWDYVTPLHLGCNLSGVIGITQIQNRAQFQLKDCAFSNGFVMTGTGKYQFGKDRFVLRVHVTGNQNCALVYKHKGDTVNVTGNCDGVVVKQEKKLSEPERFEPKEREWTRKVK